MATNGNTNDIATIFFVRYIKSNRIPSGSLTTFVLVLKSMFF